MSVPICLRGFLKTSAQRNSNDMSSGAADLYIEVISAPISGGVKRRS